MFILNTWYVAGLSSEMVGELRNRTIAGVPVLLYRTSDGSVAALQDRCIHRQVPLSRGKLEGDQVRCMYHGMRFDATGRCTDIPSQDHIPESAAVTAYPVVERYGFVWLWLGDRASCDPALIPDYSICESPSVVGVLHYKRPRTDYRLGIDNFLDSSHVSFVHPGTVESVGLSRARPETTVVGDTIRVRRSVAAEEASPLFRSIMGLDYIDRVQDCTFAPVCHVGVDSVAHAVGDPHGTAMRTFVRGIFVPETATTCHLWTGIYRDFLTDDDGVSELVEDMFLRTIDQDIDICEAAQTNWNDDARMISIRADQGLNAARKVLARLEALESPVAPVPTPGPPQQAAGRSVLRSALSAGQA